MMGIPLLALREMLIHVLEIFGGTFVFLLLAVFFRIKWDCELKSNIGIIRGHN